MTGRLEPNRGQTPDSPFFPSSLKAAAKGLSPANFAMVMATAIVSIAANVLGMGPIAVALFWLNICVYLMLSLLGLLQCIFWFTRPFLDELIDHQRGPAFFTVTAGSCILGSQFILVSISYLVALILWVVGLLCGRG
jgi:Voltage-dependent anion channel